MANAILVIEDEATLAKNVQRYLERSDYEVEVAPSGEQGLERLESFQPDVVLLDFRLTGIDGLEVLRGIRATNTKVKVIFMTAHGNVETAVEAMKNGADEYLTKPVSLAELKLLVDKAVGQDRLEGALTYYQQKDAQQSGLGAILGESSAIQDLKESSDSLFS